ncbi:MAG TPA: glycosyltransferase family 1 protein [Candidatus Acetothermia bacterium]|nr:glycosyltransferase family 1 protein [Candidatus Acetothermia bacterium]
MPSQSIVMITPHGDPLGRIGEPDVGGQCVYIRELSSAFAAQGAKVLAFTRDRSDGKPKREQMAPGADVIRIPCGPKGFLTKEDLLPYLDEFAATLSSYLRGDEVISSHFWDGGYVAGLLKDPRRWIHTSHSLGKRKLASLPEADPAEYKDRIAIETDILQRCNSVIASTGLEKQDLVGLYGANEVKVTVIPPGVDANYFHPRSDKKTPKKKLGLSADPMVFALGRLDPRKGFDLYFRAAAQVREHMDHQRHVQFVLSAGTSKENVHEAKERNRLQGLLESLSIEDSVTWRPVLPGEDIPRYYEASDVFVMPSRYELFGIVMLEAMACGIPVVATKFGGPPEVITDGENGRLVDPTDIESFAAAMTELIQHPKERERMGRAARQTIESEYSWETLARRHLRLYFDTSNGEG